MGGGNLTNTELELYRRVDEVLHYVWDPIGISRSPSARDEYQAYIPKVFAMLQEDVGAPSIAAYLDEVVAERMSLIVRPEHSKSVAALLFDWKAEIYGKL